MTNSGTEFYIGRCLHLIEESLGWGKSDGWSNYDFSNLSNEVHKRTQVRLSETTLKRIWGRLKYDSMPTLTTLNALARFAGFTDWRGFCAQQIQVEEPAMAAVPKATQQVGHPVKQRLTLYTFLVVAPIIAVACFLIFSKQKPKTDPDRFEFQADKMMTEGVPNSVVFRYDATAAATDSIYIVQTWDIRRKKLVSKQDHEHSAIYYYPGFFRTKLIADGEIVKRHDLWITTNGWLCLVEKDPIPFYFKDEDFRFDDRIEITEGALKKYNMPVHPDAPKVRFFNQRDLGNIMSDNFTFETSLKNEFNEGAGKCQFVQVLIQCKDDIIIIPLAARSCIGDLQLYFCGKEVNSTNADLSKFGCDLNQWTKLRVETVNKQVVIFVNDVKAYSLVFPDEPTGVVGVQYRFNGAGAVKDTRFEWDGGAVKL